jgi:hypothetical protein
MHEVPDLGGARASGNCLSHRHALSSDGAPLHEAVIVLWAQLFPPARTHINMVDWTLPMLIFTQLYA